METTATPTPTLPSEATALPVISEYIGIKPGYCGGQPHILGHRIKVKHVAIWYERMGMSPDEIVSSHPGITLAQVHAALAYYYDHRGEIERDIREGEAFADKIRAGAPSIFEKVRQRNGQDDPISSG
jgi:uncharacterized protein (DUF433 family)